MTPHEQAEVMGTSARDGGSHTLLPGLRVSPTADGIVERHLNVLTVEVALHFNARATGFNTCTVHRK